MSVPALQVSAVSVAFGGLPALSNVDLSVTAGEVRALIGPNGSGKTTLVNVISGFLSPDQGKITVFGVDITGTKPYGRTSIGIGRTFQTPAVIPRWKVAEYLEVGLHDTDTRSFIRSTLRPISYARSTKASRNRMREALYKAGLDPKNLDIPLASLSTGQMKMVDFARVLLANAKIILLDEPSSGLADAEAKRMKQTILDSKSAGTTIIIIEHNVQFIQATADQVTVLNGGEVIASGTPKETLALPDVIEVFIGPKLNRPGPADVAGGRQAANLRVHQNDPTSGNSRMVQYPAII